MPDKVSKETMTQHPMDFNKREVAFEAAGGAYTRLDSLITLRHAASLLNNHAITRSRSLMSGGLSSRFRGRGMDFAEVRQYQPGDDIRTIDWRVTARTGKAHTKLFQEEKEKPVLLLVDQSPSMFFGSKRAFKSVHAAEVAALLAWSVLDRGDRLGGVVFSGLSHKEIKPRRSRNSVLRLLAEINSFNQGLSRNSQSGNQPVSAKDRSGNYLNNALKQIRRVARHGSTLYIISDFLDWDDESEAIVTELARHNDIVGILVYDPLEKELPPPDIYEITDGARRHRLDSANHQYRKAFHDNFAQQVQRIRKRLEMTRSPFLTLDTSEDPVASLVAGMGNRASLPFMPSFPPKSSGETFGLPA